VGVPIVGGVDALVILLAVLGRGQGYQAALAATIGSILGSLLLFFIARKGGLEYLHRYTSRGRGARLRAWFVEYGLLTIFIPSLVVVPLPLKLFVIAAGALEVNPVRFTLVLTAARVPRYFFLAWLGSRLGKDTLPYLQHHALEFLLFAAALFVALYLFISYVHRRNKHLLTDLE
jgi:membrane protein YqaA with SNARE-associated domain